MCHLSLRGLQIIILVIIIMVLLLYGTSALFCILILKTGGSGSLLERLFPKPY